MTPNASPMGQVILGFRSLLVKIAVFVLMAAMLAWILGGTLWPKTAVRVVGEPVAVVSSQKPCHGATTWPGESSKGR